MKKLLFTLTFIIMALTVYAQAYDFSYANYENTHTCTTEFFTIEDKQMRLNITSTDSSTKGFAGCMVTFEFIICNGLEKDNVSIQIKLSNGDILNCKDVQKQNSLLTIMYLLPVTIIDKNTDKDEDGYYIMSLLRTYNIVSLTIGETTINTPNMRSADTFDAMCKTLISKTGDQGQYGKRLTGGSTTSQKPQTPSTSKPSTNRTQQNTPTPNLSNRQPSANNNGQGNVANSTNSTSNKKSNIRNIRDDNFYKIHENKKNTYYNIHNFTPYELSTKIMGVIDNPNKEMNFDFICNKLKEAFPQIEFKDEYSKEDKKITNITIKCFDCIAGSDICIIDNKLSHFGYTFHFKNSKQLFKFAKQFKSYFDSNGYKVNVVKENNLEFLYDITIDKYDITISDWYHYGYNMQITVWVNE